MEAGRTDARVDYDDQQLTKLELVNGPWPHEEVMSVEQGSEVFFGLTTGRQSLHQGE